jgi:hypothetical protein
MIVAVTKAKPAKAGDAKPRVLASFAAFERHEGPSRSPGRHRNDPKSFSAETMMKKQFGLLCTTFLLLAIGLALAPVAFGQSSIEIKLERESESFYKFAARDGHTKSEAVEQFELEWNTEESVAKASSWHRSEYVDGEWFESVCSFEGVLGSVNVEDRGWGNYVYRISIYGVNTSTDTNYLGDHHTYVENVEYTFDAYEFSGASYGWVGGISGNTPCFNLHGYATVEGDPS